MMERIVGMILRYNNISGYGAIAVFGSLNKILQKKQKLRIFSVQLVTEQDYTTVDYHKQPRI